MTDDSSSTFSCDECCSDGVDQVTPEVLEGWINTDADLWGMFQPYYHLLSGRTAFGFTDSIEMYAAPKKGKFSFHEPSDSQQPNSKRISINTLIWWKAPKRLQTIKNIKRKNW